MTGNIMVTTKRDIFAWSLIALAAEPYVVSILGTFTPILLEQLARENGVLASDHLTPCNAMNEPPVNGPSPSPPPPADEFYSQLSPNSCVLPVFGKRVYIDTSSYALYTFSVSVLIQTICVLTVSGISDNSTYKKSLILIFGGLGGLATMMFFSVGQHNYYSASILAIFANSAFGCVNVLMNSYLTILIKNHNYNVESSECDGYTSSDDEETPEEVEISETSELGKIGSKISGIGTSTGYSAALIIQIASMFFLVFLKNINDDVVWCIKIVIGSIGVWWFVWQFPIYLLLRNLQSTVIINDKPIVDMIRKGYIDIVHAVRGIKDLKDIFYFLLGWFVLSDSITTINSTAILFAKTNLHMPMVSLSKIGILVMISAITGSIVVPQIIIGRYNVSLQRVLIGLVLWCLCIPVYGIVALNSAFEMYILAIWYGFGVGGLSTVSRSIYSIIIPSGKESIFFSIFSLTDKTSSILGPFVVGLIVNIFHNLRGAFWLLAFFLLVSLPILGYKFNLIRAREEAGTFS